MSGGDTLTAGRPGGAKVLMGMAWPVALAVAAALLMQFAVKPALGHVPNGDFIAKLLLDIGINIVLAVSLTMVNGFTGQFSIGHAAFMLVGGYTAAGIMYYGSFRLWGDASVHGGLISGAAGPLATGADLMFLGAVIAGGLAAAGCGFLVGLPSLRLKGDYLAIVTLGFGEIVRVIIQSQTEEALYDPDEIASKSVFELAEYLGGALGFSGLPFYTSLFWVWLLTVVTLLVAYRLKKSSYGRAFLSIREDEVASEAMGVNTTRYKVWAFVISAFFAGCAGAMFAHTVGVQLNAGELGFQKSFDIIIMVVLGGLGSISGAAIAAIILTVLPELLRWVAEYRMVVYAVALILMMILRPKGLLGVNEVWDLWPGRARRRGGSA